MAAASDECEVAPPEGPEPPPTSPTRRVLLVGTPPRLLLPQSGGGGPAPPPGPPGRAPAERSAGSQPLRSAGHELASQVRGANASGRLWSFEGAGASAPSRAPLPPLAGGAEAGSQSARGPQDRRTSCQLVLQLPDSARGMPFSRVVHAAHGQRPLRSTWQSMHFDGLLKQRERAGEHLAAGRSSKWDALRRLTGRASPLGSRSPPATLRGGLAGGPAEPPERTIVLRKSSVLDLLGADVERYERRAWQVRSLEEAGVIARWNRDNAGAAIEPGDVIVEVNGVRGDPDAMLVELQGLVLKVTVARPGEIPQGHGALGWSASGLGGLGGPASATAAEGAAAEAAQELPVSIARLGEAFVRQCGSLDRAFAAMDYNRADRFSMGQWNTGLVNAHVDCEELCGLKAKQVFKMIAAHGPEDKYYVSREAWGLFWEAELGGSEEYQEVLCADLGEHGGRRFSGLQRQRTCDPVLSAARRGLMRLRTLRTLATGVAGEAEGGGAGQSPAPGGAGEGPAGEAPRAEAAEGVGRSARPHKSLATTTATVTTAATSSSDEDEDSEADGEGCPAGAAAASRARRAELRAALEQAQGSGADPGAAVGAPATALGRLLAGVGTEADMETLDERERKALAEQQLLREEIRRLDLVGIEAVAYVLRAKLGSYKRKAFRYFDVANQECFTMMAWDLGMTMLRINMEGLTGIPATRVFHQMNTTKDSTVSWREWKDFFKDVRQETFDKMDAMNAKSIEERAVKQQKKLLEAIQENLRTRSAKQHRVVQKTMSRQVSEDAESAVSEARETRPRKLTGGNSTNDAVDGAHKADRRSSSLPQHPTSKHGKRGAAQPADGPEHGAWEEQLSKMQDNECKRYAGLSSQAVKGIRDACHNIGFTLHESGAEGSVDVYNYRAFADAVRARLGGLGVGESAEFGDELNEVQRGLVRQIAKELGLRAADRDLEQGKCLVVTSKKALDDFAKVVERELRALEDGASKEFGPGLTEQQCAVVHAIAARLELAAVDAGPGSVAVGNVRTFSARVRNRLRALEPGGKAEFRWLTRVTSHAVRAIAAEMGLHSEDVEPAGGAEGGGGGGDACVEVHRLHEGPGGQPPSAAEGGAAAGAAPLSGGPAAEGASAAAAAEGGAAGWRQHGAPTGEAAAGEGSGDQIRSQQNLIENLFDTLATGSFQGQRIFLRFPDLGVLVSELNSSLANAVSTFKKYEKVLETTFNDTLQLQIDMDVRTSKGLTFRWFQVFMQTAMKKIGHSALAFLFTISRKAA